MGDRSRGDCEQKQVFRRRGPHIVILRWMYLKGDLRPLADVILKGHEIDEAVLNALALMILEDDAVPASLRKERTAISTIGMAVGETPRAISIGFGPNVAGGMDQTQPSD